MIDLSDLTTETRNEETMNLEELSTAEILKIMNSEDQKVAQRVGKVLPDITQAVKQIILSFNKKGRLFYIGAGTSGRLGVLDAAECVPTFGTDPKMVQGLIAGGMKAMTIAVEGAEDSPELGAKDLQSQNLTNKDIVVGIAASGRTPYVIGGLDYAKKLVQQQLVLLVIITLKLVNMLILTLKYQWALRF
ncbi:N-acetylmuramic acid 6-phosphate etherase [Pediococcus pentosaceus]|uniref:N-acetylmuramic acid 6-phosphate etherase n=1 Tax=Pediococcus pentosaceus TaxID=1255 RepID=A0A1Y0VNE9_PEDPE|nr:N-acetylmuramic acid 6-phosphate etherase [Pediococcus pentosaceus]